MTNTRDNDGRSASGRWPSPGPDLQEQPWWTRRHDPFKRPWVKGPRPWQYKDRPKFKTSWDLADPRGDKTKWIWFEESSKMTPAMWNCDFAEIERRILSHQVSECQDLLARRRFEKSVFLGLSRVESRTVYLNSLRQIP